MPYYPWYFGSNDWYKTLSILSPHWGRSDEAVMGLLSDEWPEARTRIYYQVYQRSAIMATQTTAILDRAELDVASSCKYTSFFFNNFWYSVHLHSNLILDMPRV